MHAVLVLMLSLAIALVSKRWEHVVAAMVYVAGCEVLWRTTEARIPWEAGKYALAGLALVTLMRFFRTRRQIALPTLYIALLIPGCWLTSSHFGLTDDTRQLLSFNMSGPFSLALCALLFLQLTLELKQIRSAIWIFLAPNIGIATLALISTVGLQASAFSSTSSNVATSAGFGPNQISGVLGLGTLLCVVLAITSPKKGYRIAGGLLGLWFAIQAFLTFSRGGLLNALVGLSLAALYFLRQPGRRMAFLTALIAFSALLVWLVIPGLNDYTGGALETRFRSRDSTGRWELATADLEIWGDHPLFGVGPGMAEFSRGSITGFHQRDAAHTEYTRLLAEHGVPGFLSLTLLLGLVMRSIRSSPSYEAKAWAALLAGWVLTEMAQSATRLSVISLVFGAALATIHVHHLSLNPARRTLEQHAGVPALAGTT
jgi:hypothetical protein